LAWGGADNADQASKRLLKNTSKSQSRLTAFRCDEHSLPNTAPKKYPSIHTPFVIRVICNDGLNYPDSNGVAVTAYRLGIYAGMMTRCGYVLGTRSVVGATIPHVSKHLYVSSACIPSYVLIKLTAIFAVSHRLRAVVTSI
jgi:hypothetical protein